MGELQVISKYAERLNACLGPKRMHHSTNVAQAARELAERFAPTLAKKAEIAGLLHDNAKRLSDAELIELAEHYDIHITRGERAWPSLMHGKVSAALLKRRFGVDDVEIAQAVADHVTGRPNMGTLSCIIYVADQVAADRDFEGVDELRQMAIEDLDKAVFIVAKYKLKYVIAQGRFIEPVTVAVYNEFRERSMGHARE